jgi:predicted dehydrogenase
MNKKHLRGALIGYGFVSANGHVPAYIRRSQEQGDVQIVAVADISPVRRKLAAGAIPGVRTYGDYRELFEAEGSTLNFVDISTPPCDHAAIAHAALDRGFHVLCEKPLTCTAEEGGALLEHARRAQRVIFPCHNYKHAPMIKTIREILRSGRIGKIRAATLNTYRNTHARGVTEWNSNWRRDSRFSGGGIAMDHGSHNFYLTFDWFGSYPISVKAEMSNLDPGQYDTEDDFTAVLTFPAGLADVHLTWTAGVRKIIYRIQGEKGAITVEDDDLQIEAGNGTHNAVNGNGEKFFIGSHWADASHASWFDSLFKQFRDAMDCGDFAGLEAQQAVWCVKVINAAYRSAREGSRELALAQSVPL